MRLHRTNVVWNFHSFFLTRSPHGTGVFAVAGDITHAGESCRTHTTLIAERKAMQWKQLPLTRFTVCLLALGILVVLPSGNLNAENAGGDNFVYVMSNKTPENSVIQYRRASNGSLTWLSEVATGGSGTGANGADPLGSQDSLVLSGDGRLLLAANSGSNEISVLGSRDGKLIW